MIKNLMQGIGVLYRTYLSYANEFLKDTDVSFSESVVISNIGLAEGISQEEVSVNLYIDRAAIARNVKSLEKKGYVKTTRASSDKRTKELYLTDEGHRMYDFIEKKNRERLKYLFEDITEEEAELFKAVMNKIRL
ncbi:MAG: MarR family transcriptional regulator [Acetatifactor sp.]|nr:MarR family transcriptional regulator [Acetatifactor sp.]